MITAAADKFICGVLETDDVLLISCSPLCLFAMFGRNVLRSERKCGSGESVVMNLTLA